MWVSLSGICDESINSRSYSSTQSHILDLTEILLKLGLNFHIWHSFLALPELIRREWHNLLFALFQHSKALKNSIVVGLGWMDGLDISAGLRLRYREKLTVLIKKTFAAFGCVFARRAWIIFNWMICNLYEAKWIKSNYSIVYHSHPPAHHRLFIRPI